MRVIVVGCEYTGVTTLIEGILDWGHERNINHHLDDHFTIPDRQHLAPEDMETMANLSPALKERFQRMQLVYHIRLLHRFDHILLGGFHIEEAIYGPLYYYPGGVASEIRQYEEEMPQNAILVHLTARPEVIQKRMAADPHEYSLIREEDIPALLDRFQEEFDASLIPNKLQIDTSDLTPGALLQTFLSQSAQFAE